MTAWFRPRQRPSGAVDAIHRDDRDMRTVWGSLLRYWLGPAMFWLDLLDVKRRPSHSKLMWTVAFTILNVILVHFTIHFTRVALAEQRELSSKELGFLLAFAALSTCTAGGLDGFKTWAKSKGGGTVQAFEKAIQAESPAADAPGKAISEETIGG